MDNLYWNTPGGGLDDGESLQDGVIREMVEETGISPRIGNLLYLQQFTYGNREFLEFFFNVTNVVDYLHVDLSKTTHGSLEIAEITFIDPKASHVLPKFLATEDIPAHIAANAPPKIFNYLTAKHEHNM